jgi:nucleoside-diphosphate-sugar epimerase
MVNDLSSKRILLTGGKGFLGSFVLEELTASGVSGEGMGIRIRDLVNMIREMVGYEGDVEGDTSRPDGQPERRLEVSKAKEEFGFQAQTPFKEGFVKTIEWYKDNMLK